MEGSTNSSRRESILCMVLFLLGFLPGTIGVTAFLLPMAHGPARHTFTGSPPVDAVVIGLLSGGILGSTIVGIRQMTKRRR